MWVERVLNIESIDWAIGLTDLWLEVTCGTLIWGRSSGMEGVQVYWWIYVYNQCLLWLCIYMLIVDLDVWYVVMNMLTHEANYNHSNMLKGMWSLKKDFL